MTNKRIKETYTHKRDVVWRMVGDEAVIFKIGSEGYYTLNSAGSSMWKLMDGKHTRAQIISHLSGVYDTDEKTVEKDLEELIRVLSAPGLIKTR